MNIRFALLGHRYVIAKQNSIMQNNYGEFVDSEEVGFLFVVLR